MEYYFAAHEGLSIATRLFDPNLDILFFFNFKSEASETAPRKGVIYYGNYGDFHNFPHIELRRRSNSEHVDYIVDIKRPDLLERASFFIWSWNSIKHRLPARFLDGRMKKLWLTQISNNNGYVRTIGSSPSYGGNIVKLFDIDSDSYGTIVKEKAVTQMLECKPTFESLEKIVA